jgi:hypothetical protein
MNNPHVALQSIRNTRGAIEIRRGETVDVKPSANPGMVHVESLDMIPYTALVPADWVEPLTTGRDR